MAGDGRGRASGLPRLARAIASLCTAVAVGALVLLLTDIGCVFKLVTGLSCPGCGMTRAWLAALRLDLPAALAYHPLFWVVPVAIVVACVEELPVSETSRRPRWVARAQRVVPVVLVALLLVVWVVRLVDGADAGLLFDGQAPAGVPADVVGWSEPRLLVWLRGLVGA